MISSVSSLPTRNWNLNLQPSPRYIYHVSSLPTRNWNISWGWEMRENFEFRAYLQGIETFNRGAVGGSGCEVSSLPTRNWNRVNGIKVDVEYLSFEPTYKELKHFSNSEGILYSLPFRAYLQGIETLLVCSVILFAIEVSSLPTRNWNNDR